MRIKMLIVDDEYLVRKGIKETIDWSKYDIEIIGEANHGKKGFEMIQKLKPDIVISDIKMPVMDGVELVKSIQKAHIDVGIIILSGYKDFDFAKQALEGGAFEYLLKPIDNQELIQSVLRAINRQRKKHNLESKARVYDEQRGLLESHLFNDLLTNSYQNYQTITERIEKMKTPFPTEGYLILINIDEVEDESISHNVLSFVNNYLNQLYKLQPAYYLNHFEQDLIILINAEKEHIKSFFKTLIENFEEKENKSLSIGISKFYQDLSHLHERFEEAKQAVDSKLYLGFSHLLFIEDKNMDIKPIVKNVMNYIANHYHENITVKSASESLYVSESYLLHQFKEHSGKTFNDCLSKHRMLIAKKKLLDPDKRIYEVAIEVGYQDAKYFSQIFKKRVGLSPTEYRTLKGINA